MKNLSVFFLIFFVGISVLMAQEAVADEGVVMAEEVVAPEIVVNWETSYKEALKKAKKENKPLLIYFTGSDWCGPCKQLKKNLFQTETFQRYTEKLVLYKADFPRNKNLVSVAMQKTNRDLSNRFGQRKFPTLLMINAKEHELGIKEGMYMTEYYYPFFDKIIQNN